jgi:hypothetical protein
VDHGTETISEAVCDFQSLIAASARSTIIFRRAVLSRIGEWDVSSIRPKVTFIGSKGLSAGRSEQCRASDPIALV